MRATRHERPQSHGRTIMLPVILCASLAMSFWAAEVGAQPKNPTSKVECVAAFDQGQELEKAGNLVEARDALVTCGRDECPDALRKDCLELFRTVESSVPTIVPGARDGNGNDVVDARVQIDGKPIATKLDGKPIPVNPGPHTIRFEMAGAPPIERQVVFRVGERNRSITVDFTVKPDAPKDTSGSSGDSTQSGAASMGESKGKSIGGLILGGFGIAALGTFAGLGIKGKSDLSDLRDACGKTHSCTDEAVDRVKVELIAADISLGVGIVSLGAATWLLFSGSASGSTKSTARIVPIVAVVPGGMAATVVGTF